MRFATLLISLALATAACTGTDTFTDAKLQSADLSIINGAKVKGGDSFLLSTVAIVMDRGSGEERLCSGVLVGPQLVMTAGHCFDHNPKNIEVVFGGNIDGNKSLRRRVSASPSVHPEWCPTCRNPNVPRNDLAILKIDESAPAGYVPVRIRAANESIGVGDVYEVAGLGLTSPSRRGGSSNANSVLFKTTLQVTGKRNQSEIVSLGAVKEIKKKKNKPDQIVRYKTSICEGDSGGPAFVKIGDEYFVWGIASGVGSHNCDNGVYHTELALYHSWILSVSNQLLSAP